MRDEKTFLLKRLVKQSSAAIGCCHEVGKISREIAKICAQLSALPDANFTADEFGFIKATGRRVTAISAAINAAAEGI